MKHQSPSNQLHSNPLDYKLIKITSCSDMMYWYLDNIGDTFVAYREESDRYWVRAPDKYSNFVLKKDSKEVTE